MQKKKVIGAGVGVVVVIAAILGGVALHKDGESAETVAETTAPTVEVTTPIVEEDSTNLTEEEPKTEEVEPQTEEDAPKEEMVENTADTELETDVLQEEGAQGKAEQDTAEMSEDEGVEVIDAYMYTTADLNMRKEGTTESEVIGVIPYGIQIHVTARTVDNWYRTERGEIGYVSGKYLSEEEPVKQTAQATGETTVTGNGGGSDTSRSYGPNKNLTKEEWEQLREGYRATFGVYPEDMPPYDPSQETPTYNEPLPPNPNSPDGKWHLVH